MTPSLAAALVAGTQQTDIALATLNFDFSLVKVQAPFEYRELGASLSQRRQKLATDGPQHVTARKLGALFRAALPEIPHLIAAYGHRVSEIAKIPRVNPKGTRADGPFADLVGADGTTIWAAATSGPDAILVHLLACMLARMWSPQEATSIWVELVEERKKFLRNTAAFDLSAFATSQATLTREQLADWDASARSWLRVADLAEARKQKQLMLIVQEFGLAVSQKTGTYNSVLEAWILAMTAVDKLVQGIPQSVQDGATLLGLSAWHLYPDMLALDNSKQIIEQKDALITHGGLLTLGIKNASPEQNQGIHWSLPLSYFRYYGYPVAVTKAMGNHPQSISMDQLSLVALGSIFHEWNLELDQYEQGAKFISLLKFYLTKNQHSDPHSCPDPHSYPVPHSCPDSHSCPNWLPHIARTAHKFLRAKEDEKLLMKKLIAYGSRRCKNFLSDQPLVTKVFFGLCDRATYFRLLRAPEAKIEYLREIANRHTGCSKSLVIRFRHSTQTQNPLFERAYAYATAAKASPQKLGDTSEEFSRENKIHCRWTYEYYIRERLSTETYFTIPSGAVALTGSELHWSQAPACFPRTRKVSSSPLGRHTIYDPSWGDSSHDEMEDDFIVIHSYEEVLSFAFCCGDPKVAALYSNADLQALPKDRDDDLGIADLLEALSKDRFDPSALCSHLQSPLSLDTSRVKSLQGLGIAATIYTKLPGATVHLDAASRPLHKSRWIPETLEEGADHHLPLLSRGNSFACIAMFETGTLNCARDSLEQVMAVSAGSSIYVAAALLCDPSETQPPHEIKRVVGNIGKAGLALLVPPKSPMYRKPKVGDWSLINHTPYDHTVQDSFEHTSLHLSLTEYTIPFTMEHEGARDSEAFFQEALISVFDRSEWVADLDVLGSLHSTLTSRLPPCQKHLHLPNKEKIHCSLTSVDSWQEFLDRPKHRAIVRSHGNWLGRLAATCLSVQQGYPTHILPSQICWTCLNTKIFPKGCRNVTSNAMLIH